MRSRAARSLPDPPIMVNVPDPDRAEVPLLGEAAVGETFGADRNAAILDHVLTAEDYYAAVAAESDPDLVS